MRILIISDTEGSQGLWGEAVATTSRLLQAGGHDVSHCAVTHPTDVMGRLRGSFGLDGTPGQLRSRIAGECPDCVHLMGVAPMRAPAVAAAVAACGVRTLWSVSDYRPICPSGKCRTPRGGVCEECIHGKPQVMARRCVEGRTIPSFIALLDTLYWDVRRLSRVADTLITSSDFMRNKWLEAGFPAARVASLPLPQPEADEESLSSPGEYFCYIGPLTADSGVETLVRAALNAERPLVVAGRGELEARLRDLASRSPSIRIIPGPEPGLVAGARAVVVPSESYLCGAESVKTALCAGTPVITADIGELSEMVADDDGVRFTPANAEELAALMKDFDKRHEFNRLDIRRRARERYSENLYYKKLLQLYRGC